ncbi:hypothetical protein ACLOJK_002094 [Asimina triloba]
MAAATSQFTLRFAGGVSHAAGGSENESGGTKKVGSMRWSWRGKREMMRSLCVRSSYQSVDRINGNGRRVNGVDGPPLRTSSVGLVNGSDPMHAYKLGRFVEDRFVYRQIFVIRSYEIGPDKTATMETLMNLLQETALNHVMSSGLAGDGFGATREMSTRKLIWVVTRINIQIHQYSSWGDVIEVDTWVAASGKNGMRRDWIIRDCRTQKIITRATSTWVIMNRETRKLSKMPEQVRKEVEPFYLNRSVINVSSNNSKIDKLDDETAESVRSGLALAIDAAKLLLVARAENPQLHQNSQFSSHALYHRLGVCNQDNFYNGLTNKLDGTNIRTLSDMIFGRFPKTNCFFLVTQPRWSDMDANQHVNNVKYIGWILEGSPAPNLIEPDTTIISLLYDFTRELENQERLPIQSPYNTSKERHLSVPTEVLEHYNLTSMTLEYRRECRQSHLLESLTSMKAADTQAPDAQISLCTGTHERLGYYSNVGPLITFPSVVSSQRRKSSVSEADVDARITDRRNAGGVSAGGIASTGSVLAAQLLNL